MNAQRSFEESLLTLTKKKSYEIRKFKKIASMKHIVLLVQK